MAHHEKHDGLQPHCKALRTLRLEASGRFILLMDLIRRSYKIENCFSMSAKSGCFSA